MFKLETKITLFLSSYNFLFLLLLIKYYNFIWFYIIIIPLVLINTLFLYFILKISKKRNGTIIKVKEVKDSSSGSLSYLFSYILPFLSLSLIKLNDVIILILLFFFIGFIYVNSNMLQYNPTINLLGYKIYNIKSEKNKSFFLITKENISKLAKIKVYKEGNIIIG